MGSYGYHARTLADLADQRRAELAKDGWTVLAERRTAFGQHCWWLLGHTDGRRQVVLDLVRRDRGSFWVKTISEEQGPIYYDCPLDLLVAPEPTGTYARDWRAEVRRRASRPERAAGLRVGDPVRIGGRDFRIAALPADGERSFIIVNEQGRRYRASARQFEI